MTVDRATALRRLRPHLDGELIVAALGNPAYDLFNAGDRPEHVYLWGAMGLGHSVALGVALGAPDSRVIALEGDGGALMNLGGLATIGAMQPGNLAIVIWDNGQFDLTGGQPTATTGATDLAAVAIGCGIAATERIDTLEGFEAAIPRLLGDPGPVCLVVDTDPTPSDRVKPLVALRRRFMELEPFIEAASSRRTATPAEMRS